MSKNDYSEKKTEDRSDQLLSSEAFTPEDSGLSKEIKISLAAITVLLGVLGYAMYGHFFGSDEEVSDTKVAADGTQGETPAAEPVAPEPPVVTTDRSMDGQTMGTATTESRWGAGTRQEQPSTVQSGTPEASSGFSFMPSAVGRTQAAPAPTPQTTTDPYAGYVGRATVEPSINTWSSDTTAGSTPYSGNTRDAFQERTAQDTAGGHASRPQTSVYSSQRQTGSQGFQPYGQSTGIQTRSSWQSGSQPPAPTTSPGTAVVSSDTDATASAGLGQPTLAPSPASQQGDMPAQVATGTGVRIEPTGQYAADVHSYVPSSTYGHTGGTSSTQVESRPSSQSYNDYERSSRSSVPRASASLATVSASPDSSQDNFSDGKYTIQPNDSYWSISKKRYDTDSYFKALAQHNRAAFPDVNRLDVGKIIEAPDVSELERLYPDLCPKPKHRDAMKHRNSTVGTVARSSGQAVYVVQEGDTLFDIARYELGKASRWAEIYQLNRARMGKDFDYLTPGLELVMPSEIKPPDQPVGTMTQRSGALRQF